MATSVFVNVTTIIVVVAAILSFAALGIWLVSQNAKTPARKWSLDATAYTLLALAAWTCTIHAVAVPHLFRLEQYWRPATVVVVVMLAMVAVYTTYMARSSYRMCRLWRMLERLDDSLSSLRS